ncbi:MAG TPA: FtsX-like permease family protein, partial [Opitutaceae bacterium]|nr:FtsX-like permease family protein [Opitutaceae bacterium]
MANSSMHPEPEQTPPSGSSGSAFPLTWLLLTRFTWRHWMRAPGQTALLVLILALGVAVFVSVRLANQAAVASFSHFTETLTGQSDWTLQPRAGSLSATILPELRAALGSRPVHLIPVIETSANLLESASPGSKVERRALTVLGVDLISLANVAREKEASFFKPSSERRSPSQPGEEGGIWSALNQRPQVWISPEWRGPPPSSLRISLDETAHELPVAGVIPSAPNTPVAPSNLIIIDLFALQHLLRSPERLDRVEIVIETGPRAAPLRSEVKTLLTALGENGSRWDIQAPGTTRETAETMTRAFRLNLTVLSLIALLVGLYLIFQGLDGAVVRRRAEIAILRSLGVTRRSIRSAWLIESAALGLVGGTLGLVLGWLGAQAAVRAVGQTVNALYYATTVDTARLSLNEVVIGVVCGMIASILAGLWPAQLASRTPPAQLLNRGGTPQADRKRFPLIIGCVLVGLGILLSRLPALTLANGVRFPLSGYLSALAWIIGGGWICGHVLPVIARVCAPLGGRSAPVRLALSHLRMPSARHRLAVAALLCAIGMTAGMAVLVASFEVTVRGWIERALQADLYISSRGAANASSQNRISEEAAQALLKHPAVERGSLLASYPITLEGLPTTLSGADLAFWRQNVDQPWVQAPRSESVFSPVENEHLVVVSESFSERFRRHVGDSLLLPTPSGPRSVTIAGIYADYGNERGSILADRSHVQTWFQDTSVTHASL